ncbi:MAG: hypothetical protein HYX72_08985 [Acidobacteria bacterium]|nr:hypothetical protein [Acidobacteriota bacterium]
MKKSLIRTSAFAGVFCLALIGYAFAQHEHSEPASSGKSSSSNEEIGVFCGTMKVGQMCSHGTANIFGFKDEKADQWMALSRKYNKAVDAATLELFKDAESVLTPEQLKQLKDWFAVGLNPQINELLYGKGLMPKPNRPAKK